MERIKENWLFILIGIAMLAVIVGGGKLYMDEYGRFKDQCTAWGGKVDTKTETTHAYGHHTGSDGKQKNGSYTSNKTITYCIGKNGGILDQM